MSTLDKQRYHMATAARYPWGCSNGCGNSTRKDGRKDLRLLIEGAKVAGEDWQGVVTRLQTLVNTASMYVPIISALTPPKLKDTEAQSSSQASSSTLSAPNMTGQRGAREQAAPVVSGFKDIRIVCQDCSDKFPFSAQQQADFKRRNHELPKRCKGCITAKKQS